MTHYIRCYERYIAITLVQAYDSQVLNKAICFTGPRGGSRYKRHFSGLNELVAFCYTYKDGRSSSVSEKWLGESVRALEVLNGSLLEISD